MSARAEPFVPVLDETPGDAVPLAEFLAGQRDASAQGTVQSARMQSKTDAVRANDGAVPGAIPELGGRKDGLDPTRYGDWEKDGRCIDF